MRKGVVDLDFGFWILDFGFWIGLNLFINILVKYPNSEEINFLHSAECRR